MSMNSCKRKEAQWGNSIGFGPCHADLSRPNTDVRALQYADLLTFGNMTKGTQR